MLFSVLFANDLLAQEISKHSQIFNTPTFIDLTNGSEGAANAQKEGYAETLKIRLGTGPNIAFQFDGKDSDAIGHEHLKYKQYFQGVPVEYGEYKVHTLDGSPLCATGNYCNIPEDLSVTPSILESEALALALSFVGAQEWIWEQENNLSLYPKAETVICLDYEKYYKNKEQRGYRLAYKFDIYATVPLSRSYIYIDAHAGNVIHTNKIIKHVTGSADTRYSGTVAIDTKYDGSKYILRDESRGNGIETYNLQNGTSYASAIDFTDSDNNWTSAEYDNVNKDNAALDAHMGAIKTYDYFKNTFGRNSYDNLGAAIKSYVHYSSSYVNAFWDGQRMTYGDGDAARADALTGLDIVAHEIGHALCQHTANLVYSYESGALNEGFSDIWGAMVEEYAAIGDPDKDTWLLGEEIWVSGFLRSMKNPNASNQPDTYKGNYWHTSSSDNGGVHTNSGVLNHWMYLLSEGGSGTNDLGNSFSLAGIGIANAAAIAYRTESVYLSANSDYADARTYAIQSAEDLFGANSLQVIETTNAWYAVGVGDVFPNISFSASVMENCDTLTITYSDGSLNPASWSWSFPGGTPSTSTDQNPIVTYIGPSGSYDASLSMTDTSGTTYNLTKTNVAAHKNFFPEFDIKANNTAICEGGQIELSIALNGSQGSSFNEDFEGTYDPLLWSSITGNISADCGNPQGQALMFTNVAGIRLAETTNLDATHVDSVGFKLFISNGGSNSGTCEDADTGEEVVLEYSVDGGNSWTMINKYLTTNYPIFSQVMEVLPSAAKQAGLRLKWRQLSHSGSTYDHWGIDEVTIKSSKPLDINDYSFVWQPDSVLSDDVSSSTIVTPSVSQYISVTMMDSLSCNRKDSIYLSVGDGTIVPAIADYNPKLTISGSSVIVSGSNLSCIDSVYFDGVKADYIAISDTSLMFTVPLNISSSSFTIYNPSGMVTSPGQITVEPFGITRFSPGQGSVSDIITISGLSLQFADSVFFNDTFTPFTLVNDTTITVKVPQGISSGLVSIKHNDYQVFSNDVFEFINTITMSNGTIASCNAVHLDPGGSGNYPNSIFIQQTIRPDKNSKLVQLDFKSFYTESCCDDLKVYNGLSSSAALMGTYRGSTIPGRVVADNIDGALTLVFRSNGYGAYQGWEADLTCTALIPPTISNLNPDTVAYGETFAIEGSGFNKVDSVKLRDLKLEFSILNDSIIEVVTPIDSSGYISVFGSLGTYVSTDSLYITLPSAPIITGFDNNNVLIGDKVIVYGDHLYSTEIVKYGGEEAIFTVLSDDSVEFFLPNPVAGNLFEIQTLGGIITSSGLHFSCQDLPSEISVITDHLSFCNSSDSILLEVETAGLQNVVTRPSVEVLALTFRTNLVQEYANTISAINQYFTDYNLSAYNGSSASTIESLLLDKDVVLIPELSSSSVISTWSTVLQNFAKGGGTVIICGSEVNVLNYLGLFQVTGGAYNLNLEPMPVDVPNHYLLEGVVQPFLSSNLTRAITSTTPDFVSVSSYANKTTIGEIGIGKGKAIYLGYDFYRYDSNGARVIANAISSGGRYRKERVNIQWYKDGNLITNANEEILSVRTPGDYHVEIHNACKDTLVGEVMKITNLVSPVISTVSTYSGYPSDYININGQNFYCVTNVLFDTLKADFEILSDVTMKVKVPYLLKEGVIKVSNESGFDLTSQKFTTICPFEADLFIDKEVACPDQLLNADLKINKFVTSGVDLGFESNKELTNWQVTNGSIQKACGSPDSNALYFTGSGRRALTSPLLDLRDVEWIDFKLYHTRTSGSSCSPMYSYDRIELKYSFDNVSWSTITGIPSVTDTVFKDHTVALPSYVSREKVYLKWETTYSGSNNQRVWAIDNLHFGKIPYDFNVSWEPFGDVSVLDDRSASFYPSKSGWLSAHIYDSTTACSSRDSVFVSITNGESPVIGSISPSQSFVGGLLTITGENFSAVTNVDFGAVSGLFEVVNDSILKVYVPNLDSGDSYVRVIGCGSDKSDQPITVIKPKVAMITDYINSSTGQLRDQLIASNKVESVDLINARNRILTMQELGQYETILIWSNSSYPWTFPEELGDSLSLYLERGGGIVSGIYTAAGNPSYRLTGDIIKYEAIPFVNVRYGSTVSIQEETHPLLVGVKGLTTGYTPSTDIVNLGAEKIASWANGNTMIGLVDSIGLGYGKKVDLGYRPSEAASGGKGLNLIVNALLYVANNNTAAPTQAPINLNAIATSASAIRLNWTDASIDETGFQIERAEVGSGVYELTTTVRLNQEQFLDENLMTASKYVYRIRSLSELSESSYTYSDTVTTLSRPEITDVNINMTEDLSFKISKTLLNAHYSDADNDMLDYIIIDSIGSQVSLLYGGISLSDGDTVSYSDLQFIEAIPASDFNGMDSTKWFVADSRGDMSNFTYLKFEVTAMNDSPDFTLSQSAVSSSEDFADSIVVSLEAVTVPFEPDDHISYSIKHLKDSSPVEIYYNQMDQAIVIKSIKDLFGVGEYEIVANDHNTSDNTYSQFLTIQIDSVNDAPGFNNVSNSYEVDEDFVDPITINPILNPVFGEGWQKVFYTLSPESASFADISLNTATGEIEITAKVNEYGSQEFTLSAHDGQSENSVYSQKISLVVNDVNDVPSFSYGVTSINLIEDFEGDMILDVAKLNGPANENAEKISYELEDHSLAFVAIDLNKENGSLSFQALPNQYGKGDVSIIATDELGGVFKTTLEVNVQSVNDAPSFVIPTTEIIQDEDFEEKVIISPVFSSVFGEGWQKVFYTLSPENVSFANISLNTSTGEIEITAKKDKHGSQELTLTAHDGQSENSTFTKTISLEINSVNDVPAFSYGVSKIDLIEDFEGEKIVTIKSQAIPSDELSDKVLYSLEGETSEFIMVGLDAESGAIKLSAIKDAFGKVDLIVVAKDERNASFKDTLEINILPVNDQSAYSLSTNKISKEEDFEEAIIVTSVYADPDNENGDIKFSLLAAPDFISIELDEASGTLTINSIADEYGIGVVIVELTDGTLKSTQILEIEVTDVAEEIITSLADDKQDVSAHFEVYPIPFIHHLTIRYDSFYKPDVISLTDMSGRVVRAHMKEVSSGKARLQFEKEIIPGVYIMSIETSHGIFYKTVVKASD